MPRRTRVSEEREQLILEAYTELQNGHAVARKLNIPTVTVHAVLRRNRGTCVRCNREVTPGRKHCADCLALLRQTAKEKRAARRRDGLCEMCDQPIAPPSKTFCAEHRLRDLEYREQRRKEEKRGHWGEAQNAHQRRRYILAKYGQAGLNVLERDNEQCVICGVSYAEKAIHLHHKDANQKHNTEDNLVCLCFRCHKLAHLLIEHPDPAGMLAWLRATYPSVVS